MARIWRMANNVRSSIDAGEYKDFNLAKGGVLPLAKLTALAEALASELEQALLNESKERPSTHSAPLTE